MTTEEHTQRQHYTPLWATDRELKACERFIEDKMLEHHGDIELVKGLLRALLKNHCAVNPPLPVKP